MSIVFILVPLSLALVVFAGWGFFWAVGSGQFDELESPAWDAIREDSAVLADSRAAPTDDAPTIVGRRRG